VKAMQQKMIAAPIDLSPQGKVPVITMQPSRGWISLNLCDVWECRELLYFLNWCDIKVPYKQTVIGAAWAILQPFFTMVVFSLFSSKLARMPPMDVAIADGDGNAVESGTATETLPDSGRWVCAATADMAAGQTETEKTV
jgi:hypothetical protein